MKSNYQNKSVFQFFWQHIRPYKGLYLVMLIAPITGSIYPFAYNYCLKLFIDSLNISANSTYQELLFPIILFLCTHLSLDIAWRISDVAEWKAEPLVRKSILLDSYDYVQHHSYRYFQNNYTGSVSSKIKGILDGYDKFWAEIHHGLGQKLLKSIVNLTALIFVNFYLGLFVTIWTLIYVPVMYKMSKKLNYLSFIETESRHNLIGSVSDKISNIISLFSFSSREREYKDLSKNITEDFIPKQVRAYKYSFKLFLIGGVLFLILFCFIMWYMIYLKINNLITIGDFAFAFGISLVVAEDIWSATMSLQDFSRAMGDLKSSFSVITTPHETEEVSGAKDLVITSPKISFSNVNFRYEKSKSNFDNFSLDILAGEKVGLVGESGAGKSTLVNLLLRYFPIESGSIKIDYQNISYVSEDSLRDHIAVIPQDTMLFHRSLYENIKYGKPNASKEEVYVACKKAHIHEFIMDLPKQYETDVGERGIKLSGGQRQRIAIARAILKDAPILVLDEATSALDTETERLIQKSLEILIEDKRKTVIAIAHRLSTLQNMDRILVLEDGQIIQQGSHEKLYADVNGKYRRLCELQAL